MVGFYHIVSQFQGIVGDSVPYLNVLSRILFALGILYYRPPTHTRAHTHTPKRTQTIKTLTSQTRTQINTYDSSMIKRKKTCQTLNMILLQTRHVTLTALHCPTKGYMRMTSLKCLQFTSTCWYHFDVLFHTYKTTTKTLMTTIWTTKWKPEMFNNTFPGARSTK